MISTRRSVKNSGLGIERRELIDRHLGFLNGDPENEGDAVKGYLVHFACEVPPHFGRRHGGDVDRALDLVPIRRLDLDLINSAICRGERDLWESDTVSF